MIDTNEVSPIKNERPKRGRWALSLAFGTLIATTLTVRALTFAPGETLGDAIQTLCHWDCLNFVRVAEEGYPETLTYPPPPYSSITAAPAFPNLIRAFNWLAGNVKLTVDLNQLAPLLSQLFAALFFSYWMRTLLDLGVRLRSILMTSLMIAVFPTSFYLVTGYSESLFLFALMGFIFHSLRSGPAHFWIAAIFGILMTSTRTVGAPLALLPLLLNRKINARNGALSILSFLGIGGYLLFCQIRYGHFDMYLAAQAEGWQVRPDYLFFLKGENWRYVIPFIPDLQDDWEPTLAAVPFFLIAFLGCGAWIWRLGKSDAAQLEKSIVFFVIGGLLFYVSLGAMISVSMQSMIRYIFISWTMLMTSVAVASHNPNRKHFLGFRPISLLWLFWLIYSVYAEFVLESRYLNGLWVG